MVDDMLIVLKLLKYCKVVPLYCVWSCNDSGSCVLYIYGSASIFGKQVEGVVNVYPNFHLNLRLTEDQIFIINVFLSFNTHKSSSATVDLLWISGQNWSCHNEKTVYQAVNETTWALIQYKDVILPVLEIPLWR